MSDLFLAEADRCPKCDKILYGSDCVYCKKNKGDENE